MNVILNQHQAPCSGPYVAFLLIATLGGWCHYLPSADEETEGSEKLTTLPKTSEWEVVNL